MLAYRVVALVRSAGRWSSAAAAWTLTQNAPVAVAAAHCGPSPSLLEDRSRPAGQRFARFEEQLPDAIDVMRRALMAGHPFNAALKLVVEDMDDPVAREFEI